jgi:hypothetical protein
MRQVKGNIEEWRIRGKEKTMRNYRITNKKYVNLIKIPLKLGFSV